MYYLHNEILLINEKEPPMVYGTTWINAKYHKYGKGQTQKITHCVILLI